MKKNSWYMALKSGHVCWLSKKIYDHDTDYITQWIADHILNSNSNTTTESKRAFYDAVQALMEEFITENKYDKAKILSDSIDSEKFKHEEAKYQKLTFNQCIVVADAIKASKESLKKNDNMHKGLHALLNNKYSKLTDTDLKGSVSTLIEEALGSVDIYLSQRYMPARWTNDKNVIDSLS